jgi:probable rRNA maturation factor
VPATVDWQAGPRLVPDEELVAAVEAALRHGGRPGVEMGVVVVDDATLAAMHAEWLDDASLTDVITFDLGADLDGPAGEVYVSVDRARAVAAQRGIDPARELVLYVVHGVLHLCGFDDHAEEDRRRMRLAEREVLVDLGYPAQPAAEPDA